MDHAGLPEGTEFDTIDAEFVFVQKMLLKYGKASSSVPVEIQKSYEFLLFRVCSLALTDMLKSLLALLDNISPIDDSGRTAVEDYSSTLVYDCLAIAHEKKLNHVILQLLKHGVWKPNDTSSTFKCRTPLHSAAANGDLEIVKMLIEYGVDVNQRNSFGETAIHVANDAATTELLANNGADVNALTTTDMVPSYYAFRSCRYGMFSKLEEYPGKPRLIPTDTAMTRIPLSCVWYSNVTRTNAGKKPLSLCVSCKNENIVLLDAMRHKVDTVSHDYPPMHLAVMDHHSQLVEKRGVSVKDILKILSMNDPTVVNALDQFGASALYLAVERNLLALTTLLLNFGAEPDLTTSGRYPVVAACRYLSHQFVRILLERGASPNVTDRFGDSPLDIAAGSLDLDLVKMLVKQGADVKRRDRQGKTALHAVVEATRWCQSARNRCVEIAKFLLDKGSDVNQTDDRGETALSNAIRFVSCQVQKCIFMRGRFARASLPHRLFDLLLQRGADVNLADVHGYTAVHQAARYQCYNVVREFLKHGGDPKRLDKNGKSPLSSALHNRNCDIRTVRILLAAGADLDSIDWDNGEVCASVFTNIELFNLLLDSGLKINLANEEFEAARPLEAVTLIHFFIPFCNNTEPIVRLFKAGSSSRFLATCCKYKREQQEIIDCPYAGRLCQAMMLDGYRVQRQHLVQKMLELEESLTACNDNEQALASWMAQVLMTPPTLRCLSRCVVRLELSAVSGCRTILPLIDVLPIPNQLRMYLRFEGPLSEIDLTVSTGTSCVSCSDLLRPGIITQHRIFDHSEDSD